MKYSQYLTKKKVTLQIIIIILSDVGARNEH